MAAANAFVLSARNPEVIHFDGKRPLLTSAGRTAGQILPDGAAFTDRAIEVRIPETKNPVDLTGTCCGAVARLRKVLLKLTFWSTNSAKLKSREAFIASHNRLPDEFPTSLFMALNPAPYSREKTR